MTGSRRLCLLTVLARSLHQYCAELWCSQFRNNVNKQEKAKKMLDNHGSFEKLLSKRLKDLKKYLAYKSKKQCFQVESIPPDISHIV